MGKRIGRSLTSAVLCVLGLATCGPADESPPERSHPAGVPSATAAPLPTLPQGWAWHEEDNVQVLQHRDARVVITVESPGTTTTRLQEIAGEWPEPVTNLTIEGWPAIQRTRTASAPIPGAFEARTSFALTMVTTAIAAGPRLIRFEATLADPRLHDEVLRLVREIPLAAVQTPAAARTLRLPFEAPRATYDLTTNSAALTAAPGFNGRVNNNANVNSETEVAVSADGQHIVIVNNTRDYVTSNDFGTTFTQRFNGAGAGVDQGDPSVAFGASGNFYTAHIRQPNGTAAAGNV
jgi:hypothetical protein